MESVATVVTRCKASPLPPRLGNLRLPHFPQPRRRIYLQTINPGGGSFLLDRGGIFLRCQSETVTRPRRQSWALRIERAFNISNGYAAEALCANMGETLA